MINNATDKTTVIRTMTEQVYRDNNKSWGNSGAGGSQSSIEHFFFNTTDKDITISDFAGVRQVIQAHPSSENRFIIRIVYNLGPNDFRNIALLYGSIGETSEDLKIVLKAVEENKEKHHYHNLAIGIDHIVTAEDFREAFGNLYLCDIGYTASTQGIITAPSHPHAIGSVTDSIYMQTLGIKRDGFTYGIGIELINNQPGAAPMYVYNLRRVHEIPLSKNKSKKPDGFYITTIHPCIQDPGREDLKVKYYKLDEASEIGIYKSEEEALSGGDVKVLREAELAQRELENTRIKDEINRSNLERKRLEDDAAIRAIAQKEETTLRDQLHKEKLRGYEEASKARDEQRAIEIANLERRNNELKDFYENKNMKKKDWLETLKIIGTTITTMGVLILGYNKTFGSKD